MNFAFRVGAVLQMVMCVDAAVSASAMADEAPIHDVVIGWSPGFPAGQPSPELTFYVDGELIGEGRQGMEAALDAVGKLPRGTSVVWGPDLRKVPDVSSRVASTAPVEFPDLWERFKQVAKARGLALSSTTFPSAGWPTLNNVAKVVAAGSPPADDEVSVSWHVLQNGSLELSPFGTDAAGILALKRRLAALPEGRTVRFSIDVKSLEEQGRTLVWNTATASRYDGTLARVIQARGLRALVEMPAEFLTHSEKALKVADLRWTSFDGLKTPHDQVVYLWDGNYVGRGDRGFDAVLKLIAKLPEHTVIFVPDYDVESNSLRDGAYGIPFRLRKAEFDDLLRLRLIALDQWIPGALVPQRKSLWQLATIVRDGREPKKADAVLGWKTFDSRNQKSERSLATYMINGEEVGQGMDGFLAALAKLESLSNGSVLRVDPACIRTQGPFRRPVMFPGKRHFEFTGIEPYGGLRSILIDVVERKTLVVELIPDEKEAWEY